jgi:hypothetical protein
MSAKAISHHWKPIEDIEGDLDRFRDRELEALWRAWTEQRKTLDMTQSLAEFNGQLAREWAIETGVIEGVYTLDKGVTKALIKLGIESGYIGHELRIVTRNLWRAQCVHTLMYWMVFLRSSRMSKSCQPPISRSFMHSCLSIRPPLLRSISSATLSRLNSRKGDYKTLPNSPTRKDGSVHEYCPPEHTASEMDRLIELHSRHEGAMLRPELQAVWLHHAFTQIHPFQDGNGRVARALSSFVFIKAGQFAFGSEFLASAEEDIDDGDWSSV